MSRVETYGTRSPAFSILHHCMPSPAYMIDLDYLECCRYCQRTLLLGETAKDIGQTFKATRILQNLATAVGAKCILVFYEDEYILDEARRIKPDGSFKFTQAEESLLYYNFCQSGQPVVRVRELNRAQRDRRMTLVQFYEFICMVHKEHEVNCPALLRSALNNYPRAITQAKL